MNKLALGTAQFGSKYGIANNRGQVKFTEVEQILKLAKNSNIDLIDTAIGYGNSEKVLGKIGVKDFKLVSKLIDLPHNCEDVNRWVEEKVEISLKLLGIQSLYGLLVHSSKNLLDNSGKKLIKALNNLKINGLVKKIGISIYDPIELDQVMHLNKFDIIQAPLNIIDRRLEVSGWLSRLSKSGVEVHTRSTFLQGLLLMKQNKIPKKFNKWQSILDQWSIELEKNSLNAIEECLSYPLSLPEVSRIVVGVDNFSQFKKLIEKFNLKKSKKDWSFMISDDQMLINPYNWIKL